MKSPVRIASRPSRLAMAQVDEVIRALKSQGVNLDFEILKVETGGDKDKTTPLPQTPDNFFTDTIDQALLEGKADAAVHSAKDLPQNFPENLKILGLTKGLDDKDTWAGRMRFKELPPGARVGTSSELRQAQILQMRPDVQIVQIRGTIEERLQLVDEGKIDGIVVAHCALKRLGLEHRTTEIFPWEGMALQGQLAVVGRSDDPELEKLFSLIDARRHYGKVTLVGAGPGDKELITLKGVKALEKAECVFYDYLVDAELLKHAPGAEHIYAGKRKGEHSLSQEELSRMLKEKARAGHQVVRLKGGDPLIFGRGADEIQYLDSYHIRVDVIPGITSATGIPSSLGIPLTARGLSSSVAFVSGHEEDEDKAHPKPVHIPQADTLVFLMGLTKLNTIVESLGQAGWPGDTPMMIVANGTKPQEKIVKGTVSTILELAQDLKPPALIITGKTINFYRPKPRAYLYCGTHPQLYGNFGKIVHWPMIEIRAFHMNTAQYIEFLQGLDTCAIIVFTSPYAVEYFFKAKVANIMEKTMTKTLAVIGQGTAQALQNYKIKAAMVSDVETAEGLLQTMAGRLELKDKKILLPRSNLPNPYLKEALTAQGARVTEITIYENNKPPRRNLPSVNIEGVIFTSPSTVQNFLADYGTIPASWQIIAKGPVTLKALKEAGYPHAASLS